METRYMMNDTTPYEEMYARFIRPGDLVFDIGANIGRRTKIFLKLGARVIAVEPVKENVRTLFARFHDQAVTIVPRALSDSAGERPFRVTTPNIMGSSLNLELAEFQRNHPVFARTTFDEIRTVRVTTLDALIAEYGRPAFIKIDVEGHEAEVLKGLSQPVPALSFEFLPHYLDSALQSLPILKQFGPFVCNFIIQEHFHFELHNWATPDEMMAILRTFANSTNVIFGDVYARFTDPDTPGAGS